jgi:hypothetical protein
MRVIATDRGYDGLCLREPDAQEDGHPAVFDMPDGSKGKWFVEADENGVPLKPIEKAKPNKTVPGAGPAKGSQVKDTAPLA